MSSPASSRRVGLVGWAALLLAALFALSACGSSGTGSVTDSDSDGGEPAVTASPTPANADLPGTVVRIKITGHSVTPDGSQVQAKRGKPVTLLIDASGPGELHVHSSPEQHIEYPKGTSAATLTFKNPGVIDVESHALDKLIVQFEVR